MEYRDKNNIHQIRDRQSATILSFPLMCLISKSYSCSNRLQFNNLLFLFLILFRNTRELWSVYTITGLLPTHTYISNLCKVYNSKVTLFILLYKVVGAVLTPETTRDTKTETCSCFCSSLS